MRHTHNTEDGSAGFRSNAKYSSAGVLIDSNQLQLIGKSVEHEEYRILGRVGWRLGLVG
jgi:hypothetical protein